MTSRSSGRRPPPQASTAQHCMTNSPSPDHPACGPGGEALPRDRGNPMARLPGTDILRLASSTPDTLPGPPDSAAACARQPTYSLASLKADQRGDDQRLDIVVCIQSKPNA